MEGEADLAGLAVGRVAEPGQGLVDAVVGLADAVDVAGLLAVSDLAAIGDYLSERNPAAATSVERRIRAVVDLVARFPASGPFFKSEPTSGSFRSATILIEFSTRLWVAN